jgi:murein DD-endopeptidase MepM/ murein hydrolase activator NlpD
MKKRYVILILAITAALLASFIFEGSRVFSSSLQDIENQIGDAGDRKDDIAGQIDEVNDKIAARQQELDESTRRYTEMLREKQQNTDELQQQLEDLDELYESIAQLNDTIAEMEAEYDASLALFFKRAAITTRYSNYSSLKLFTESRSIFTYTDLTRLVSNMLENDVEEMERLKLMKQDIEAKKQLTELTTLDLQAAIAEKEAIIEKIINDQEILEADMQASRKAIEKLEAEEDKLEEESQKLAKEIKELRAEYDAILERQRKEKEEAERKAREAAEKEERERQQQQQQQQQDEWLSDPNHMVFPAVEGIRISSPYGWRIHPVYKTRKFHNGIDIAACYGTDIVAALSGTVTKARWNDSYGYYVLIYHGDGMTTLYGHCSKLLVHEGDYVERGQRIALVGSTGVSTGNHLHFEIRIDGETRDPMDYLPPLN